MQRTDPTDRLTGRLRLAVPLGLLVGLSGCFFPPPNSETGLPETWCGIFYGCGNHSDNDGGGSAQVPGGSSGGTPGAGGSSSSPSAN
jgi:hypothetical protein